MVRQTGGGEYMRTDAAIQRLASSLRGKAVALADQFAAGVRIRPRYTGRPRGRPSTPAAEDETLNVRVGSDAGRDAEIHVAGGVANGKEMMPEEAIEEMDVIPEEEEMSEYERKRLERIQENKQTMLAVGILQVTQKIRAVDKPRDLAPETRHKQDGKSREKPPVNPDLMRKLRTHVAKPDGLDEAIHEPVKQVVKDLYPGAAPLEDEWVGCDGCSKWRKVPNGFQFDRNKSFFCSMIEPLSCETPEEHWDDEEEFVAVAAIINNDIIDDRADATLSKPAGEEILTNLGLGPTATQALGKKRKEPSSTSSAPSNWSSANLTTNMARGLDESESDLSSGDAPPKKARRSYKGRGGAKSEEEKALRKFVEQLPGFQMLSELVEPNKMCELVNIGLHNDGRGLEEFFFSDGSMVDFCRMISDYNRVKMMVVKKSKMKMLMTWDNRNDVYYVCNSEPLSASNITLTVKGKHNLLMHIDTAEDDNNSHDLETLCRNKSSDIMTKLFNFSRSLPDQVETINLCKNKNQQMGRQNKLQHQQQRKIMHDQNGLSDKQARRRLAGLSVHLWRGLFPDTTAVAMVMLANPTETKKRIYSRSAQSFANEPVAHATYLQRSAVTFKMSTGTPFLQAHREVGQSKGINLIALFGLDKNTDDDARQKTLADLCFNRVAGYNHFGAQQELEGQKKLLEAGP
mmetsp:Transcript_55365/g.81387  ORF Transcript_55365/g.81387 Transcript_55365/m.81387 type:complete len:686 (-) Transcript_55365:79-2136(-)